jgi:hypothetical protein
MGMMLRLSVPALCAAAFLCGSGCVKEATPVPTQHAELKVVAVPSNASVYLDGHYFGRAKVLAVEPKRLAPGLHLMTVQADDHFPRDVELELAPGVTTVKVELRPVPP